MYPVTINLFLVCILAGCGSARHGQDLQLICDRTLGNNNVIEVNEAGTFALCQQKPTSDHARRKYRFIVIRLDDRAIVHEGTFSMGHARWLDDKSIEVFSGSPSPQEGGTKKIIHVNSPLE